MTTFVINYPMFSLFLQLVVLIEVYRITQESFLSLGAAILFLGFYILARETSGEKEFSGQNHLYQEQFSRSRISPVIFLTFFLIFFLLFLRFSMFFWQHDSLQTKVENSSILAGEVISVHEDGYIMRYLEPAPDSFSFISLHFFYFAEEKYARGDILWFLRPQLKHLYDSFSPHGEKAGWLIKGVKYSVEAANIYELESSEGPGGFKPETDRFSELRNYFSSQFDKYYPANRANLLKALLLGKRGLNPEAEKILRRGGAGHVLALSGLHIGYISLFSSVAVNSLAKITGIIVIRYISVFIILGYVMLAGASPSLLRAGIMSVSWIILLAVNKSTSTLNLLGLAGTLILLSNPYYLYLVSFQLSFLVILAITFYLPKLKKIFPSPLALSISAQIGAQPLLIYLGGELNLNGLIANLILIPLLGPIIFINLLFLLFVSISENLAQILALTGNFLLTPFLTLAEICAQLPFIVRLDLFGVEDLDILTGNLFLGLPLLSLYLILLMGPFIIYSYPTEWLAEKVFSPLNFVRILWWIAVLYFLIYISFII